MKNDYELEIAELESNQIHYSDEYFKARNSLDDKDARKFFTAGFERAWKPQQEVINALKIKNNKLRHELKREEKIRQSVFNRPCVGHDYWERYYEAEYQIKLEALSVPSKDAQT